jgi:bifunctional non-homologous end joining protein LigD
VRQPTFIAPMLCTAVKSLPSRASWWFEPKCDGYRCVAVKDGDRVTLFSRNGNTFDYPEVSEAVRKLPAKAAVIDGEIVGLDAHGVPCFELLGRAKRSRKGCAIRFYAFDLLHVNGHNPMLWPIEERKDLLREIVDGSAVLFCPSFDCEPGALIAEGKRLGFEGVVAKRRGSVYKPGERNGAWLKMRVNQEADFVIGGYAPGNPLESVLVGYREGRKLLFAGNVHAGLNPSARRQLFAQVNALEQTGCPFANLPDRRRDRWNEGITAADMASYVWVKPKVAVRVAFREWTSYRRLRHPLLRDGD